MHRFFLVFFSLTFITLNAQINISSIFKGNVTVNDTLSVSSIHVINKSRGSATINLEEVQL